MADVGFSVRVQHRDEFGRFAAALTEGARRSEREASEVGAVLAAALAPKRSGALAASVRSTEHGFAAGAPYAAAQEEGGRPHKIRVKYKAALYNPTENFGPTSGPVLHPGNPATHFMRQALSLVNQRMMGIIRSHTP